MGTASTKKFLKNVNGTLTEEAAVLNSAGAGDANKVPALNASGVLDPTIVNGASVSTGAADAEKVVQLNGAGRIDSSMMPVGIGADTATLVASEALAGGDLVNVWNDAGMAKVRKADGSATGKEAHGFVTAAVASGANATVYFEGTNSSVTGLTPGPQFLSAAIPGKSTSAAPTSTGQFVQYVGLAIGPTAMNFEASRPIVLA